MESSRRDLLKGAAAAGIAGIPVGAFAMEPARPFTDILRVPDLVRAFGKDGEIPLTHKADTWEGGGVEIQYGAGALTLRASVGVTRIQLRWRGDLTGITHYLGDGWERSYADLSWQGERPGRPMPWYFLAHGGGRTHAYGVRTEPHAMCFWCADSEGISLWADVRSGGVPVELGDRTLSVCTVICREGKGGESPFAAAQAFCRTLCPQPRLADHPIYGTNDWNYAYGNNSANLIATISRLISDLSPDRENRPYSVIDDGWSSGGQLGMGPWLGNERFGDMGAMAERLKGMGVRPGLWFRPLTPLPGQPDSWKSQRDKSFLDPTIPEVKGHVADHLKRFADWGYEMVKHDFSSFDMLGRWGSDMGASPARDGWSFHDKTKTTAEVVLDLYHTIRAAAGSMRLIGCNTFTHLAAGTHEVQRTGDDTSGRSWNRTRRMGVNTLAFRAAHQGSFYAVDPDIVALTRNTPWELTEQWLRLVAGSGTALFVSVEPEFLEERQRTALKKALTQAAKPQRVAEPLDWLQSDCPRRWILNGKQTDFAWMGESGSWPFGD